MSTVPNWQTRERITALESANERLRAERDQALKDCDRLFAHASNALDQRDAARATAVAFEQQLDLVGRKLGEIREHYTIRDVEEFTGESKAALDAIHDAAVCIATVTDDLFGDLDEDGLDEAASVRLREVSA